ncbi:MAG TPA: hypothetical protein VGQ83_12535 [Polyangia bacterium]|jgi:hypothetical protein
MQPVSGRSIGPVTTAPARGAGAGAAGRAAPAAARDEVQAAVGRRSLEALLGRLPVAGARGAALLLGPPPGARGGAGAPRFVAASHALRGVAARAQAAGRPDDPLLRAALGLQGGGALRAAVECEQRLGRAVADVCGLREQVAAGMAAIATG